MSGKLLDELKLPLIRISAKNIKTRVQVTYHSIVVLVNVVYTYILIVI